MANQQVTLASIDEVFQDYIKVFNEDYHSYRLADPNDQHPLAKQIQAAWEKIKAQLMINTIKISDDQPTVAMVELAEMTKITAQVDQKLNADGYYRMAKTLNTILGDVQTLAADQIICLGHTGQSFIVIRKEPAQERDHVEYYYGLETVIIDSLDSPKDLFQKCRYLMTDDDIAILSHPDHNEHLDAFFSAAQQVAIITNSIVKLADFNDLYY